jgi:adenylate cyclase class 2
MTIQLEQEAKFRLASAEEGVSKLAALGADVAKPRHFEANILYDFRDERISKRDEALRLRRVDDEAWLTWKGPQHGSGRIKRRRELETRVDDGDAVEGILDALGAEECFRYEKYRACYRLQGALLTLDETPIGVFLEIEATPELIAELASELGLTMADAISLSYPRLYERYRLEIPDAPRFMVFPENALPPR